MNMGVIFRIVCLFLALPADTVEFTDSDPDAFLDIGIKVGTILLRAADDG